MFLKVIIIKCRNFGAWNVKFSFTVTVKPQALVNDRTLIEPPSFFVA